MRIVSASECRKPPFARKTMFMTARNQAVARSPVPRYTGAWGDLVALHLPAGGWDGGAVPKAAAEGNRVAPHLARGDGF